jgi:hypothetical protein
MPGGGGGPAEAVIWAGRVGEVSGSTPAAGGGQRRFGHRGRQGGQPCYRGFASTVVVVESVGGAVLLSSFSMSDN